MRKPLILIAVILSCAVSGGAQSFMPGTVSGQVTGAISSLPVPSVAVIAHRRGAPPIVSITDSSGNYSLTGFGPRTYMITPSKAAEDFSTPNGVTLADATLINQHVVGVITLTATQQLAADVDGNGIVQSFDAALIQQWTVGINNSINQTGSWKFSPALTIPDTGVNSVRNYTAILMGDVNGDWSRRATSAR